MKYEEIDAMNVLKLGVGLSCAAFWLTSPLYAETIVTGFLGAVAAGDQSVDKPGALIVGDQANLLPSGGQGFGELSDCGGFACAEKTADHDIARGVRLRVGGMAHEVLPIMRSIVPSRNAPYSSGLMASSGVGPSMW